MKYTLILILLFSYISMFGQTDKLGIISYFSEIKNKSENKMAMVLRDSAISKDVSNIYAIGYNTIQINVDKFILQLSADIANDKPRIAKKNISFLNEKFISGNSNEYSKKYDEILKIIDENNNLFNNKNEHNINKDLTNMSWIEPITGVIGIATGLKDLNDKLITQIKEGNSAFITILIAQRLKQLSFKNE
jgi:hypothetical protein